MDENIKLILAEIEKDNLKDALLMVVDTLQGVNVEIQRTQELLTVNSELRNRIKELEKKTTTKDFRKKQNVQHKLGFSLSKVKTYYHAVKTVDGVQLRVYIGRDMDTAERKIIDHFVNNFRFHKSELKQCEELRNTPEIKALFEKELQNITDITKQTLL